MLKIVYLFRIKQFLLLTIFFGCLDASSAQEGYVVVLDPGHGGRYMRPVSIYGDKYDARLGHYLDKYREGASYDGLHENIEMYELATRIQKILILTHTSEGRKKFHELLKKYNPKAVLPSHAIQVYISRTDGYYGDYETKGIDINGPYRLYDYPDIKTGKMQKGTISRINALRPHLVVSMHLTSGRGGKYGALSAVITPGFDTYKYALDYMTGDSDEKKIVRKKFLNGPYNDWFNSGCGKDEFEWFLCDAWIYFTGYWSKSRSMEPDFSKFRGNRYNFLTWSYSDPEWPNSEAIEKKTGSYSPYLANFKPEGRFWEREKSDPEKWRREGGPEGYGGDNLYAANELLRFVRYSLYKNGVSKYEQLPRLRKPYLSTWSVPTHVNAISAFLELAYIDNSYDYRRIKSYKNVHAEAIAVGIYSLFYGLEYPKSNSEKDLPWGNSIDFSRYKNHNGSNYFNDVVD